MHFEIPHKHLTLFPRALDRIPFLVPRNSIYIYNTTPSLTMNNEKKRKDTCLILLSRIIFLSNLSMNLSIRLDYFVSSSFEIISVEKIVAQLQLCTCFRWYLTLDAYGGKICRDSSIGQRKFLLDRIRDPKVDGLGNILSKI